MKEKIGSATREYVACCSRLTSEGRTKMYFRGFRLPEEHKPLFSEPYKLDNDTGTAGWYFLSVLNFEAFVEKIVCREDFDGEVKDQEALNLDTAKRMQEYAAGLKAKRALNDALTLPVAPATPATPARLDSDGTAEPLTRIVSHPKEGWCIGSGTPLHNPEYENEKGERIPLK